MKSITNLLLFVASVALLAMCFVAVNVFVGRLSLDDLSNALESRANIAKYGADSGIESASKGADSRAESRADSRADSRANIAGSRADSGTNIAESRADSSANIAESTANSIARGAKKSWSAIFSRKEVPHYRYPTPEMFLSLDFSGSRHTDILQISNLDAYKFFCLKEILKSNNIKFTYKIVRQNAMLEIALDSAKKDRLLADLARYNIRYNLIKG